MRHQQVRSKILIYTDTFLTPSMTFIARQLEHIRRHFDVSVIARRRQSPELFPCSQLDIVSPTPMERLSARVMRRMHRRDWTLGAASRRRFEDVIECRRPQLIHAHFGPSGLAILPLAMRAGIPLVTTFHGFDASSFLQRNDYVADLSRLFRDSNVIAVSREMHSTLIGIGAHPTQSRCHYIGIPLTSFPSVDRVSLADKVRLGAPIRFLQVSNFVEKKGHYYTVQAFSQLAERHSNVSLTLVGHGPLLADVQALVRASGCRGDVHFLEHQDTENVSRLMREADCFVHHSVTATNGDKEGIPTVLMEAMATNLPVLSTFHAGIPELVENGQEGLLSAERDIGAYVANLEAVLTDDGSLGRAARLKIESTFDIEKRSAELCDLYAGYIDAL